MHASLRRLTAVLLVSGLGMGCRGIDVRTMAAPDTQLDALHTFRVLANPARRDGRALDADDDPMINNSIANRALRERLVSAFQQRGYALDAVNPDFGVAFYATSRERVDPALWDYGYPFYPDWPRYAMSLPNPTRYLEGTVVVDVIRLQPRRLLWRGEGVAQLSNDPADNLRQLARAADAIVAHFPRAAATVTRAVAERR